MLNEPSSINPKFHFSKRQYIYLSVLGCMWVVFTLVAFTSLKSLQQANISLRVKEEAGNRIFLFQQILDESIAGIVSLGAFYDASDKVTRQEFQKFSAVILQHHPGIQSIGWLPRVPHSERQAYEELARKDVHPAFQITEMAEGGGMVRAGLRDEYFPVSFREPLTDNEQAVGFDLGSNQASLETLNMARNTGKMKAISRIVSVQEPGGQSSFLVFLPIFQRDMPTDSVAARRKALLGFVLGESGVGSLLEKSLSVLAPQGLDIYIYDESVGNHDANLLYDHQSRILPLSRAPAQSEQTVAGQDYTYSLPVMVADRTWKVLCVPTPDFLAKQKTWQVWGVPCIIFMFGLFLVGYLFFILDRAGKAKHYTEDLLQAKNDLEHEIVERKMAEAEKLTLQSKLQQTQKMESIGNLAGGIAHDFNNILSIILGYAELAMIDNSTEEQRKNMLGEIIKAGNRASDLVRQILSFSRKGDQVLSPIKPHEVVKEAVKLLRATIPTTIEIQTDIDPSCGIIFADRTQLHQILTNLCTNAMHAMQERGVLSISLKRTTLGENDLHHRPDMVPGSYVRLSVRDTGPGMEPEIQSRIFEPFFTTKEVGKGTGMGLSVVHGLVTAHHGMITVTSEPGKGTAFHVHFAEAEGAEVELAQTVAPVVGGNERILLVDDEESITALMNRMLSRLGYYVTTAKEGTEALDIFQNHPGEFDVVITDQTMPGMTGVELAQEIFKIQHDIPIILCTGFSSQITREKVSEMGIQKLLMKPVERSKLARTIRLILEESKLRE